MSSTGVVLEPPSSKPQNNHHANRAHLKNGNNTTANNSKRKSKHDRSGRKRSRSFSGCGLMINPKPVPPTKFLLGGNINDPLNLNSLQDEEINRAMNAVTPKSSPVPTPPRRKGQIEVIIPPNINDPLNLIGCADDAEYEQQMNSPMKKARKKRLKKRRTTSVGNFDTTDIDITIKPLITTTTATTTTTTATATSTAGNDGNSMAAKTPEASTDSAKIPAVEEEIVKSKDLTLELSPKKEKAKRKSEEHGGGGGGSGGGGPGASNNNSNNVKKFKYSMDKIVSPVVPQPGAWTKRTNVINKKKPRHNKKDNEEMPQFKDKNKRFQYGNYDRYYGYRNPNNEIDHRLRVLSHHRYLFEGKDILDIGCNIGHVTLSVARDFGAKSVTGIDIDPKLIGIARKNVKHYVKSSDTSNNLDGCTNTNDNRKPCEFFPISMPILYGSIDIPGFNDTKYGRDFPNNVLFKTCNYVLDEDSLLTLEQPQFDVILCLSVTKWIHLNWADSGMKQAFRRMYAQLRPGGKLILEPQNWASYKNKRKLTEEIFKNYNSIEFFPEKFTEYLLSSVVGFAKSEIMGYPHHHSRGFQRPIQVFTKSTMFPSERIEATPNNSITPNTSDSIDVKSKTEKYESQAQIETSEHIYCTTLLNRFCGDAEQDYRVNHLLDEELHCEKEQNDNPVEKKSTNENT